MRRGWIITAVTLCFMLAAGTSMADDPKLIKMTTPAGTVVVNPGGTEVTTPAGNVKVKGSWIEVNTPKGVVVDTGKGGEALRYNCSGNRTITVTGKVISAADGVVFRATGNCTLKLKDLMVSGHMVIEAKGNSDVKAQDCTFVGSSVAIKAGGNAELDLQNITLTAPAGIVASGNAEVRLLDSTITASETAIETRGMATVDLKRCVTTGKRASKGSSEINEK